MPRIKFTRRFLRLYARLPVHIQEKVKKQVRLLAENPRHPSLQTKPIQGVTGIYEARVDQDFRLTYEREANDTLVLRVVGKHDEALKRP
ncbi:MAG: type II toxin-antitoxin system mRNA interferase toxin, RelE/StbE family [Chloroflexota bacterium]